MGLSGIAPPPPVVSPRRYRSPWRSLRPLAIRLADVQRALRSHSTGAPTVARIRRGWTRGVEDMSGFWAGADAPEAYGASEAAIPNLEVVHAFTEGPMPTGVSVSAEGRIFVNFPKWGDDVRFTVGELRDGQVVPYPDEAWNSPKGDDDAGALVSVQSIVVDPADRLWILDTGSPLFQPTRPGGPKLVRVDLASDSVEQVITFPDDVVLPTSYVNDVRFDLSRG